MRPGITILLVRSTTVAPRGTGTSLRAPAATTRPPWTTSAASSITGPPVPPISRAPTHAVAGVVGNKRREVGPLGSASLSRPANAPAWILQGQAAPNLDPHRLAPR